MDRCVSLVGKLMILLTVLFVTVYLYDYLVPEQEIDLSAVDDPPMLEGNVHFLQNLVDDPFLLC